MGAVVLLGSQSLSSEDGEEAVWHPRNWGRVDTLPEETICSFFQVIRDGPASTGMLSPQSSLNCSQLISHTPSESLPAIRACVCISNGSGRAQKLVQQPKVVPLLVLCPLPVLSVYLNV